jgi:hypothetical protein
MTTANSPATQPQGVELLPCPLCKQPLEVMLNGRAVCRNAGSRQSPHDGCLLWLENAQLHVETWQALHTIASRPAGETTVGKAGRQALAAELLGHLDRITSMTAAFHLVKNLCKIELGQEPDSLGSES